MTLPLVPLVPQAEKNVFVANPLRLTVIILNMQRHSLGQKCCVFDCHHYENKNRDFKYYSFPGRPLEVEKRQKWIEFVTGTYKDKEWEPSENSRICSAHFLTGRKSEDLKKENYLPTILPGMSNIAGTSHEDPLKLQDLHMDDLENNPNDTPIKQENMCHSPEFVKCGTFEIARLIPFTPAPQKVEKCSVGCQTETCMELPKHDISTFTCTSYKISPHVTEIELQCDIFIRQPEMAKKVIAVEKSAKETKPCFMGFSNIKSDDMMREFGGLSKSFFSYLFNLIESSNRNKKGKENELLITLMKLKMNLPFPALGCFFPVYKRTVSRVFGEVLDVLYANTKSWITWPTKEELRKNLPVSFKKFPKCKCLVDIMEIETHAPTTVEQKTDMYCETKEKFMIKCLIAMTARGLVCMMSKVYGGSKSNDFIMKESGLLNLLEPGDSVMMEESSAEVKSLFLTRNIDLLLPPVTDSEFVYSDEQMVIKVLMDKVFQRLRCFRILDYFEVETLPFVEKIIHLCCVVANGKIPTVDQVMLEM